MKHSACIYCGLLSVLFAWIMISCTKDLELDKFSTDGLSGEWAFPLINSTLTIQDLLADTTGAINTGDDGLITLVYKAEDMISMDGEERTSIPDQQKTLTESFNLPNVAGNVATEVPLSFDFVFELLHENHRIDTMYFKQGMYTLGLKTNLNRNMASIDLLVNNFLHSETGIPLSVSFDLSNPDGQELIFSEEVDLTEYYVQFYNDVQQNTVYIDGIVHFEMDSNPDLSPYYFELVNDFAGLEFSRFIGFVAENEESYSGTIAINIFKSTDFSNIAFGPGSVRLNFDVYNSLGLPIVMELNRFTATNTTNTLDSIELTLDPSTIGINYPSFDEFNTYAHTEINTDFVDINSMIDISPDRLFLSFTGHINRDMPPETVNYFADNSNLIVEADIEVDLFAGISAFQVSDTLDFDPAGLEGMDMAEFMVVIENGFPIHANVQVMFLDAGYNDLFGLFETETALIEAGSVGPAPEFKVVSPTTKKTFVVIGKEKLDLLQNAQKLLFSAVLSTNESQYVKIYSDYSMHLNLGAKIIYAY